MELHLKSDLKAKLDQWTAATGRPADELVEEAMAGYFDELAQVGEMLDCRYDDIKTGQVLPIDGAEALARLQAMSTARRTERRA